MYNEIDLDAIDTTQEPPTEEPARQYYFMAKCGNGPEPEELEATKVGRKDREMNGTIPHGAIDWD